MKIIILKIIALIFASNCLFAQYNWINPYPQANKLNDIQIVESNLVVATGKNGTFLRSNNFGNSWIVKQISPNVEFFAVHFTNSLNGIVGGENGSIFKTTNGGETWEAIPFSLNENIIDVQLLLNDEIFVLTNTKILYSNNLGGNWSILQHVSSLSDFEIIGNSTIWSCGDNIYKSIDSGNNWEIVDSNYHHYYSLSAIDENTLNFLIYPGDGGSIALRTIDGGINLSRVGFPENFLSFEQICSVDENTIICIGLDNFITHDAGVNWTNLNLRFLENHYDPWLLAVAFNKTGSGFIVGSPYNRQTILRTSDYGHTWELKNDFTNANLKSISFLDSLNCFIVGSIKDTGKIWQSYDAGKNWSEIYSSNRSGIYIDKIKFIDENFGYAAGNFLYITHDSGMSWSKTTDYWGTSINDVFFLDSLNGWIIGSEFVSGPGEGNEDEFPIISKTIDGGITWSANYLSVNLNSIEFYDSLNGYIACGNGDILVSNDGGDNWELQYDSNIKSLNDLFILNKDNIYISGSEGRILYTNDGGDNWNDKWIGTMASTNSIKFIDNLVGFATSNKLHYTKDGGVTWREINVNYEGGIYLYVDFTKEKAIVVGYNGVIIEIPISAITDIEQTFTADDIKKDFRLFQNYPNPFNPTTQISYQIPKNGFVNLVVYNILGQVIFELVNEHQTSGEYSVQFNAKNLSSGVYFYKIIVGNYMETKKLILLR
jgi:photosystem II stability/assembly factor-like uncharacterized protein